MYTCADAAWNELMEKEDVFYSWTVRAVYDIGDGLLLTVGHPNYEGHHVKIYMDPESGIYNVDLLTPDYKTIKQSEGYYLYLVIVIDRMLCDKNFLDPGHLVKMKHYNHLFKYTFIPRLLDDKVKEDFLSMNISAFDDISNLRTAWNRFIKKEDIYIEWHHIKMKKTMNHAYTYYLLDFPGGVPKVPDPLFGMIFINSQRHPIYITLEYTNKVDEYHLSQHTSSQLNNIETVKMEVITMSNFEEAALDLINRRFVKIHRS